MTLKSYQRFRKVKAHKIKDGYTANVQKLKSFIYLVHFKIVIAPPYHAQIKSCIMEKPGGGEPGGTFPSGPHQFHFLGGTRGDQYITKMGSFYFSWIVFSNCNSCIGDFGPFETLGDPFPRGPPRPSPPPHLWNNFSSPVHKFMQFIHIHSPWLTRAACRHP